MTTHYYTIFWTRSDGQGDIPMTGSYPTADRSHAVRLAACELLAQCGTASARAEVMAGTIDGEAVADILAD